MAFFIHIHTRVYANTNIPVVAGAGAGAVVGAGRATWLMVKWGLFGAAMMELPPQGSFTCWGIGFEFMKNIWNLGKEYFLLVNVNIYC